MELTKHAEDLLKKSYYQKDADGKVIENWEGLCRRVAEHLSKGDYCTEYSFILKDRNNVSFVNHIYDRKNDKRCCGTCHMYSQCEKRMGIAHNFFKLLYNQYFIVNTPSLMNSGTELGGLSACFIIEISDSMESILTAVKQMGMILKTGGGVGFSFGNVRQKGAKIGSTGGVSSGVISWLKIFNQVVEEVKQGGRRRGAGSCVLPAHHPDILEYLTCKTENSVITNFNLSVGVTNEFMTKVKNNEDYNLIEPHTGNIIGQLNAKEVFDIICKQAFSNGEPGLFFLDTVNKDNPVPKSGDILSGNPCILPTTKFLTKGGEKLFSDLEVGEIVWTGKNWSPLLKIWSTGIKPVYRYTTEHGYYIECTTKHQIVQKGLKVEIKDAFEIDIANAPQEDEQPAYLFNRIVTKDYLGDLEVFDFTVEADEHTVWANGLLISNCFEFVLPPYNSCTLGAINLSKIITKDIIPEINYTFFDSIISTAVRMLDNTITMNKFPIPEIEEVTLANRPIGLGFLNLSELFIKLGLVYGSDESLEMAGTVTSYMRKKAIETSIELAKERGAYPNFDVYDWMDVNREYIDESRYWVVESKDTKSFFKQGVRNSTVLSIAPNGSTGVIVNASSGGVEPIFAVSYERKTVDCGDMHMVNPLFEELMFPPNKESVKNTLMGSYQFKKEKILSEIEDNAGSVKGVWGVPEKIQKLFVTAREIPYEQHIKMQAKIQNSVDLSISKTISLFADATITDVKNAYTMAHVLGCKGITIYREGSRENEVLSTNKRGYKEGDKISGTIAIKKGEPNIRIDEDVINLFKDFEVQKIETKALQVSEDGTTHEVYRLSEITPKETTQLDEIIIDEETYEDEYDYIVEPRERKDVVVGYTYKISLHGMKVYITINFNEDEMTPIETFILAGKPGDDINAIAQSIGRLVSLSLKFKVPIDEIMQQIDSMAGDEVVWMGGDKILSIPDAVAKALKWAMKKRKDVLGSQPIYYPEKTEKFQKISQIKECPQKELKDSKEIKTFLGKNKCPNCGDNLVFQEGCRKCLSCDYNKCG